jgi:hypothetical protein
MLDVLFLNQIEKSKKFSNRVDQVQDLTQFEKNISECVAVVSNLTQFEFFFKLRNFFKVGCYTASRIAFTQWSVCICT